MVVSSVSGLWAISVGAALGSLCGLPSLVIYSTRTLLECQAISPSGFSGSSRLSSCREALSHGIGERRRPDRLRAELARLRRAAGPQPVPAAERAGEARISGP